MMSLDDKDEDQNRRGVQRTKVLRNAKIIVACPITREKPRHADVTGQVLRIVEWSTDLNVNVGKSSSGSRASFRTSLTMKSRSLRECSSQDESSLYSLFQGMTLRSIS
jgi:hypothetical protein